MLKGLMELAIQEVVGIMAIQARKAAQLRILILKGRLQLLTNYRKLIIR